MEQRIRDLEKKQVSAAPTLPAVEEEWLEPVVEAPKKRKTGDARGYHRAHEQA